MSWHKEFLSESNTRKSISSMGDLFKLIEEVYEHKKETLFTQKKTNIQLLRERFESGEGLTLTSQAIPEIAVSELGWTNITGEGDTQISGPERRKLEQFLANIQGNSFQEKISSLSRFYDDPDVALQAMFPDKAPSMPAQISAALGYLTFFKTLTKVISNFNAASAGFNFEAFLAVLSGGEQVKANTGTIADFIARIDGTNTPISLKLYQEGKLHVGGSFTDLANDLAEQKPEFDHPFMRYLAVTKKFEGGQKEGLDINGKLRWFQFDFTLENVFDLLSQSSTKSQKCIMLPKAFISGEVPDFAATLPGSAIPSPEELEQVFVGAFSIEMESMNKIYAKKGFQVPVDEELFNAITAGINWSSEDAYFNLYDPNPKLKKGEDRPEDYEPSPSIISRGDSTMMASKDGFKSLINVISDIIIQTKNEGHPYADQFDSPRELSAAIKDIAKCAVLANNGGTSKGKSPSGKLQRNVLSVYSRSKLKDQRLKMLNEEGVFASIEESRAWYGEEGRTDEQRKAALKQCYGYLTTEQFNLNQSVVEKVHTLSKSRVLPEGQSKSEFGVIYVGAENTQNMLNRMTGLINDAIFGIFLSVKAVQDNTYAFMAGGMREEAKADAAIEASNDIIEKTTDLKLSGQEES